ncbi:hypothetical protein H0Z60_07195 [Ectothiorhodospiraceae bacterium WFHF3C12]|nr:hypothetical protein [Ectothiorhodospiraceae bacterium WFHF3C12]
MARAMTPDQLVSEKAAYRNTGGVSECNRQEGFRPAFMDLESGIVYASRNPDGSDAPCHRIDTLPEALVVSRRSDGRVEAIKGSVVAGFQRNGRFFTRDEAARIVEGDH